MSWAGGDDVLADYDAISCMTSNTPMNDRIGFSTPPAGPVVPDAWQSLPKPVPAHSKNAGNNVKTGTGRGAVIEALRTEYSSQHRKDLERQGQLRQHNPHGYSNTFIEQSFGAVPSTPKLVMQSVEVATSTRQQPGLQQSGSQSENTFCLDSTKDFPFLMK